MTRRLSFPPDPPARESWASSVAHGPQLPPPRVRGALRGSPRRLISPAALATFSELMVRPRPCAPRLSSCPSSPPFSLPASPTPATTRAGRVPATCVLMTSSVMQTPTTRPAPATSSARARQSAASRRCPASASPSVLMMPTAPRWLVARQHAMAGTAQSTAGKRCHVRQATCASRTSHARPSDSAGARW